MSVLNDPKLESILGPLHATSDEQIKVLVADHAARRESEADLSKEEVEARMKVLVSDKLFALDKDKAEFCYQLCRALGARRIVEVGTSYGVSTVYLAAAVRDNLAVAGGEGIVVGTEHEPGKAAAARDLFERADLNHLVDLREGDLHQTLLDLTGPIDFVLVDIWPDMARPAIERIAPHLREGAVLICDNTVSYREAYADYFTFIEDGRNGFRTQTLPFKGGLEMTVKVSK